MALLLHAVVLALSFAASAVRVVNTGLSPGSDESWRKKAAPGMSKQMFDWLEVLDMPQIEFPCKRHVDSRYNKLLRRMEERGGSPEDKAKLLEAADGARREALPDELFDLFITIWNSAPNEFPAVIDLEDYPFHQEMFKELCDKLVGSHVETLKLSHTRMTDASAKYLADLLAWNKIPLKVLEVQDNSFGDVGAQALLNAKCNSLTLKKVDVSDNHKVTKATTRRMELWCDDDFWRMKSLPQGFNDEYATVLLFLNKNPAELPKVIDFEDIHLNGQVLKDLSDVLVGSPVETLRLSNTEITKIRRYAQPSAENVQPLAEILARNQVPLKVLELRGNHIDDFGADYFNTALSKSSTLNILDLRNNNLSETMKEQLQQTAKEHGQQVFL